MSGRKTAKHRPTVALASSIGLGAVLAVAGLVVLFTSSVASPSPVTVPGVDNTELAADGILLLLPDANQQALVSEHAATQAALAFRPGMTVRSSQLVHLIHTGAGHSSSPLHECFCYVVSELTPNGTDESSGGGPPSNPESQPTIQPVRVHYFLVFVDANTGQMVLMLEKGG